MPVCFKITQHIVFETFPNYVVDVLIANTIVAAIAVCELYSIEIRAQKIVVERNSKESAFSLSGIEQWEGTQTKMILLVR